MSRLSRAQGEDLSGKTVMYRPTATSQRAAKYGLANQQIHERDERADRKRLMEKIGGGAGKKEAARQAQVAANKKKETGMNAGTAGGSRGGY